MTSKFVDIPVSPSRAASVLEMKDLRLVKLTWEMTGAPVVPPYSFDMEPQLGYARQDKEVAFQVAHHFTVYSQGDKTKPLLTGDAIYQVGYRLTDSIQLNDEDLSVFGSSTVVLAVYPFLRELLHSLTARSGLPPLVLPLIRTHVATMSPGKALPGRKRGGAGTHETKETKQPAKSAANRRTPVKRPPANRE